MESLSRTDDFLIRKARTGAHKGRWVIALRLYGLKDAAFGNISYKSQHLAFQAYANYRETGRLTLRSRPVASHETGIAA